MAKYSYQGSAAGSKVDGTIEAANESEAAIALKRRNIVPLSIKRITVENAKKASNDASSQQSLMQMQLFVPQVTLSDLVMFSRQMYSLLKAGIPIIRAIQGLAETTTSIKLRDALTQVGSELEKGRPIANAMASFPKVFSKMFISMVNVGENTGKLDAAFLQLAQYLEDEQETRKRIQSATRYPIFVILAVVAAIFLMNIFVIPTFADMFAKFDAELPWTTQLLITSSHLFVNYWHIIILAIVATVYALNKYVQTSKGKLLWDQYKLRLPAVGSIIERSTLSRFARSFSMMLRAGVPLTHALQMTSEAVDNAYVGSKVVQMRRGIEKGDSMLRTANATKMFTPLVMQMIAVGEETGQIDNMLEEVADYYEREVDYDLKSLTAKIEPILIAIVAGIVMILALGIFMPMWDMMNTVKG
ncbi:type II secretion system protein [Catenovulum agarivorans DS-2]|uniref:Type II secretion system protein n=1 Tax=Catenovulum agarivorans DS-2 TaxID=1328313 RepID=W7QIJ4_9ALTE|nr:type II secretion system F family protein [Catenovulum agarivorans]EWH08747.1 type II secretion system protein [Catenovulum agarivorans DS-2]